MRPSAAENAVPCGVIVRIEPALDLLSLLAGATPSGLEDVELARASSKSRRAGLGWAIGVRIWPAYHRVRPLRMRKGRVYDLTRPSELTA